MTGPDFTNTKGVVNDLVTRQAKFGSFKASSAALSKKYDTEINENRENIWLNSKTHTISAYSYMKSDGTKCIIDKTSKSCPGFGYTTGVNSDKFVKMDANIDGYYFIINDSNKNGIVDKKDGISIKYGYPEKNVETTIEKFLGM